MDYKYFEAKIYDDAIPPPYVPTSAALNLNFNYEFFILAYKNVEQYVAIILLMNL